MIDRSLRAPVPSIATVYPTGGSILCASHTVYLIDLETKKELHAFKSSSNPVRTILASNHQRASLSTFLTVSEADRVINVFDLATGKLAGMLIPEAETISLALSPIISTHGKYQPNGDALGGANPSEQSLAAVNREGTIELFSSPFDFAKTSTRQGSESTKARIKGTTKKATATIKVIRPDRSSALVPILNASFEGSDIVLAWTEGGVNLVFDRVRWQEESTGKMILQGMNELVKAKSGAGVGGAVMNGVKDMGKSHVDDSHAVVANGEDLQMGIDPSSAIDISSAEDESEYSEEEDDEEDEPLRAEPDSPIISQEDGLIRPEPVSQLTSQEDEDVEMKDADEEDAVTGKEEEEPQETQEEAEPSFGERIRANAHEAIDVQASFPPQTAQAIATVGERSLQLPSGMSLGTVLTQSLRTNDVNLLETCFHVADLQTVRATIERIDSSLATVLLQRLAERLHSRPGRAGSLMVWIQWTLVAHGGYLAGQPEVMRKLTSLHRVVTERANSLQSLLSLKGKLDMLEAQMNLRKSMQARSRAANALDEDDEEGVIYVEGQEESDSEDEDVMQSSQTVGKDARKVAEAESGSEGDESDEEDDEKDEMPTTMNGVVPDSEDEDSDSDDEGLIDDEAVSTDEDSDDGMSADGVDHEDVSSIDSDASSKPEDVPPPKRLAKAKLANGPSKNPR